MASQPDLRGDVRLSVVIPALDEGLRIADTVARVRRDLAEVVNGDELEIVVVDDGSRDGTAEVARDAGAEVVLSHDLNRGKGAAVRTGVLAASGRTIVFTDADLAYSPDHLVQLLEGVERGEDVVVGSRSHPESQALVPAGAVRSLGSRGINLLSSFVLARGYGDTQSGLKGFRRDVAHLIFSQTQIDGMGFDIEVLYLVERFGLSVEEIPVRVSNSPDSSVHVLRDGLNLARDVLRVHRLGAAGRYEPTVAVPDLPSSRSAPGS